MGDQIKNSNKEVKKSSNRIMDYVIKYVSGMKEAFRLLA